MKFFMAEIILSSLHLVYLQEQSKLEKFFKNTYSKTMTEKEFSVKGWNYGAAKFEGAVLSFDVSSMPSFEVPLNNVSGCTTGKNEVTLEFHQVSPIVLAFVSCVPPPCVSYFVSHCICYVRCWHDLVLFVISSVFFFFMKGKLVHCSSDSVKESVLVG